MGYYINPPDMTKEAWLWHHGVSIERLYPEPIIGGTQLQVVLVDNGDFTAAGICYDKQELDAWRFDKSARPKKFFLVLISKLREVGALPKNFEPGLEPIVEEAPNDPS